jgi:hypothetical protein
MIRVRVVSLTIPEYSEKNYIILNDKGAIDGITETLTKKLKLNTIFLKK